MEIEFIICHLTSNIIGHKLNYMENFTLLLLRKQSRLDLEEQEDMYLKLNRIRF